MPSLAHSTDTIAATALAPLPLPPDRRQAEAADLARALREAADEARTHGWADPEIGERLCAMADLHARVVGLSLSTVES